LLENLSGVIGDIQKVQEKLKQMTVEAGTEKGTVRVVLNGNQEIMEFYLDRDYLRKTPAEEIQNIIADVFGRAIKESKQMVKDEALKISNNLGLPNIPGLT
jgi:DNA-binding protein YbaB